MNKVSQIVYDLALPVAQEQGLDIWDVEYLREGGQWFLRVYIDKPDGISMDDCEAFSRAMDPILDEADPIEESYVFEVSSAGLERALKRPGDFERFMGSNVEVKLYKSLNGGKEHVGTLTGYNNGDVSIKKGQLDLTFPKDTVAQVRLRIF